MRLLILIIASSVVVNVLAMVFVAKFCLNHELIQTVRFSFNKDEDKMLKAANEFYQDGYHFRAPGNPFVAGWKSALKDAKKSDQSSLKECGGE